MQKIDLSLQIANSINYSLDCTLVSASFAAQCYQTMLSVNRLSNCNLAYQYRWKSF